MSRKKPQMTHAPKGLRLTDAGFQGLHEALDKVRSTSATVKVSKEWLADLLADYSLLHERLDEVDLSLRHASRAARGEVDLSLRHAEAPKVEPRPVGDGSELI